MSLSIIANEKLSTIDPDREINKTVYDEKLYRQALYFYFQADYTQALRQVSINKIRLGSLNSKGRLFTAGLELAVGLQHQARNTLLTFQNDVENSLVFEKYNKRTGQFTQQNELLLVALLQLIEQNIQQGQLSQAKENLQHIEQIPTQYYQQYHVLSQLAYWPESPKLLSPFLIADSENQNIEITSPYIQMNRALRYFEKAEYDLAIPLLLTLKNLHWQNNDVSFWQSLFNRSPDNALSIDERGSEGVDKNDQRIQNQAVNDYARLLLAQLFVSQENYQKAFNELESFPEHSPYAESALFLFAFSAQKIKQYTIALNLFNLLTKEYTYSNLAWQSGQLLASQITEQKSLAQGLALYQQMDEFYQDRLQSLKLFEANYNDSINLLAFSNHKTNKSPPSNIMQLSSNEQYMPDSKWLQKALSDVELSGIYHELIELDILEEHIKQLQKKNYWLADTISLNQQRKSKVAKQQAQKNYHEELQKLTHSRDNLHQQLPDDKNVKDNQVFADKVERKLLTRIEKSQSIINNLVGHKNTDSYQTRLNRVDGVLAWQLNQSYPQRRWQHQKQLKQIDHLLVQANNQLVHFESLAKSNNRLKLLTGRQQSAQQQISVLLSSVKTLRAQKSENIRTKVASFVMRQNTLLKQHSLATKKAMATVLEKMLQQDKRIEKQLVPDDMNTVRAEF
ncbi:MAG: hypothetical protein MJK12_07205 [Colwellia sp.]|nr:hypothetical protein [Colwellia sp.]